jgi:hypothetical protein
VVSRVALGGIRYCGRIDETGVRRVRELLQVSDSRLVITSMGGEFDAPLQLSALVEQRRLDVEVAGPCFSACAALVFMAGNHRIVSRTGVLGFHNTSSSAFVLASRIYQAQDADLAHLGRRSSAELGLYARRAIDPGLLIQPQLEIGTLCVGRGDERDGGEGVFDIVSRLDLWIPDLATLLRFGVASSGHFPLGRADVERRLSLYLGAGAPGVRFVFGAPRIADHERFRWLYGIGPC